MGPPINEISSREETMSSYSGKYGSYGNYGKYGSSSIGRSSKGMEILKNIGIVAIAFAVIYLGDMIYGVANDKTMRFTTLLNMTAASDENTAPIRQDLTKYTDAIPIGVSVNERTGIEFAYSFYLLVGAETFTGEQKLRHVFHKGYQMPWPLMGPGVFIMGHTNTMRIFMNTNSNPYSYVDVKNIPVQKWFHVVLNCYKSGLDVYVNGSLANRMPFNGAVPYQNYEDIVFFSKSNYENIKNPVIAALPKDEIMSIHGSFSGLLASLKYARYALSSFEINKLMTDGPSPKRKTVTQELPPYLADNWWSNQKP
jgi:hypothetical protein